MHTTKYNQMDPKLYRAVREGQVNVLLQNKDQFGVQLTPNKNNFLHLAALFGHSQCAYEFFRNCSWLLLQVNASGKTPLHLAALTPFSKRKTPRGSVRANSMQKKYTQSPSRKWGMRSSWNFYSIYTAKCLCHYM